MTLSSTYLVVMTAKHEAPGVANVIRFFCYEIPSSSLESGRDSDGKHREQTYQKVVLEDMLIHACLQAEYYDNVS